MDGGICQTSTHGDVVSGRQARARSSRSPTAGRQAVAQGLRVSGMPNTLAAKNPRPRSRRHEDHARGRIFVKRIAFGESRAIKGYAGLVLHQEKKCPVSIALDALHKEIRHPVRRIHVMGSAAIISSVLSKIQELFNIDMPCLQVTADSALPFASLVHRQWPCHSQLSGKELHPETHHWSLEYALPGLARRSSHFPGHRHTSIAAHYL